MSSAAAEVPVAAGAERATAMYGSALGPDWSSELAVGGSKKDQVGQSRRKKRRRRRRMKRKGR